MGKTFTAFVGLLGGNVSMNTATTVFNYNHMHHDVHEHFKMSICL